MPLFVQIPDIMVNVVPLSDLCFQDPDFSVTKNAPVEDSSVNGLVPAKVDPTAGKSSSKTLADVVAALPPPPGGLKRKHSGEGPSGAFSPPSKLLKPGKSHSPPCWA